MGEQLKTVEVGQVEKVESALGGPDLAQAT